MTSCLFSSTLIYLYLHILRRLSMTITSVRWVAEVMAPSEKGSALKQKNWLSMGANSFVFFIILLFRKEIKQFQRVASPECASIPLKYIR